ncbi:MAG TPA: hypothetical protein VGC86_05415 [Afipia sp.]
MKDSDTFRENAENCLHLAERAGQEQSSIRYRRMAGAWMALAEEQDWLDGNNSERASELAEGAIDRLVDRAAGGEDLENRKSQLINGPAEFRDARVDQDK